MKPSHVINLLAFLLIGLALYLLAGVAERVRAASVTIQPAPETTRELIIVERYWFRPDRSYRVQIRHIDGHPAWAMQDRQSNWTSAFNFQELDYPEE